MKVMDLMWKVQEKSAWKQLRSGWRLQLVSFLFYYSHAFGTFLGAGFLPTVHLKTNGRTKLLQLHIKPLKHRTEMFW